MIETLYLLVVAPLLSGTTITAIQTVAVAVLVFLGQFAVARLSNKAQEKSTDVESQSKATEAWQKYAEEMRSRLDSLEGRLTAAERRVLMLEVQSVRDLDLLGRILSRFRHFMQTLHDFGHHEHVSRTDEELARVVEARIASDPLNNKEN